MVGCVFTEALNRLEFMLKFFSLAFLLTAMAFPMLFLCDELFVKYPYVDIPVHGYCFRENIFVKGLHFAITGGGSLALFIVLMHSCLVGSGHYVERAVVIVYLFACAVLSSYYIYNIMNIPILQDAECYSYPILILLASFLMIIDYCVSC